MRALNTGCVCLGVVEADLTPALVSPKEFKDALAYLPSNIQYRLFNSGLAVLHAPQFSQDAFAERLLSQLGEESKNTLQVAQDEHLSLALATEMCEEVEGSGKICRDEQGDGGVTWWPNLF